MTNNTSGIKTEIKVNGKKIETVCCNVFADQMPPINAMQVFLSTYTSADDKDNWMKILITSAQKKVNKAEKDKTAYRMKK